MTQSPLPSPAAALSQRRARSRSKTLSGVTALACVLWGQTLWAQREPAIAPAPAGAPRPANVVSGKPRQVLVEVFVKNECTQCTALGTFLAERQKRGDLRIKTYNVEQDPAALRRLHALCRRDGVPPGVPAVYSCGRLQTGFRDAQTSGPQFDQLVGFEVFVQDGCPHCLSAKRYLETLQARTPGLQITFHNLSREAGQLQRMQAIARQRGVGNPQVPFFSLYGQTLMGFDPTGATGRQLGDLVDQHFAPEPPPPSTPPISSVPATTTTPTDSAAPAPAKSGG